jgi:hypothetical protein
VNRPERFGIVVLDDRGRSNSSRSRNRPSATSLCRGGYFYDERALDLARTQSNYFPWHGYFLVLATAYNSSTLGIVAPER